jgi:hypothetical protein
MLVTFFHIDVHIAISLAVVGGVLLISVIASLLFPKKEEVKPNEGEGGAAV